MGKLGALGSCILILACCGANYPCRLPVSGVRVIDGDTLVGDIDLPLDVTLRRQVIRFAPDFDAWELTRRRGTVLVTDDEIVRGHAARDDLVRELAKGALQIVVLRRGVYGRIEATPYVVTKDGVVIDVIKVLKAAGHARR